MYYLVDHKQEKIRLDEQQLKMLAEQGIIE